MTHYDIENLKTLSASCDSPFAMTANRERTSSICFSAASLLSFVLASSALSMISKALSCRVANERYFYIVLSTLNSESF